MGGVVLLVILLGLALLWWSMPIISKPWRAKIVKGKNFNNTVDVILAHRFTLGGFASDRISIEKDIVVNSPDFKENLRKALSAADAYSQTIREANKLNRTIRRKKPQ